MKPQKRFLLFFNKTTDFKDANNCPFFSGYDRSHCSYLHTECRLKQNKSCDIGENQRTIIYEVAKRIYLRTRRAFDAYTEDSEFEQEWADDGNDWAQHIRLRAFLVARIAIDAFKDVFKQENKGRKP